LLGVALGAIMFVFKFSFKAIIDFPFVEIGVLIGLGLYLNGREGYFLSLVSSFYSLS
jgi:hypothetical protein